MRILITGGSGKAGQSLITHLLSQNHALLNLDLAPLPPPLASKVHTLRIDLTDAGQVFSAMHSHFTFSEPFHESTTAVPDAVIHLAGYARNMMVPDNETFRGNVLSTYNILEAACRAGVRKIVLAGSICTYGVTYADGDIDFPSFPVDETVDTNPMDVYGMSKVASENVARSFARRFAADIYVLRLGAIVTPEEFQGRFTEYVKEPEKFKVHGWSYTDAGDMGGMFEACLRTDGLGFQVFNAVNDEITNDVETGEFLRTHCPGVLVTRLLVGREAPISNRKMRDLLGFRQGVSWRERFVRE
ncbi:NAD-dependent epimerase/dehydratase family protein [Aspergillus affinis]|uniref:NAD-dependent epimerase/dehydratase family protein n=1 Tax=Aspergillus affinis TaxID=1070780 RepID=UPI0022FE3E89|nr:NAD(P)-binding protein [Aspergillus affinis]KAI9045962.1 NAD(P)-binding protein [Aspergillus affinis]